MGWTRTIRPIPQQWCKLMKLALHVKTPSKVHWHLQKSRNKKYNLVPNANVGNFSCPIIIETLNPLDLLLFTFQNIISIHQEKLIIKYGQKSFQTSHFKLYVVFQRGSMEAFSRYHFSVIKIVGFDNLKCIPCSCVPHNNNYSLLTWKMCQSHGGIT
jgi:hypothetical protein